MTIIHYYGFLIITDFMALFLSERRRFWYFPFVAAGSMAMLQATLHLWYNGLDGGQFWLSLLRVIFLSIRFINAAAFIWYVGPWMHHWNGLLKYSQKFYEKSGTEAKMHVRQLAMDCLVIFVMVPFAYATHWNYGEPGIDAPLTAMQANAAFSFRFKILLFCLLIATPKKIGYALLGKALFLALSWILMPKMFFYAPVTFIPHLVNDLSAGKLIYDNFCIGGPGLPFEKVNPSDTRVETIQTGESEKFIDNPQLSSKQEGI